MGLLSYFKISRYQHRQQVNGAVMIEDEVLRVCEITERHDVYLLPPLFFLCCDLTFLSPNRKLV
jgi:hypothetical protein